MLWGCRKAATWAQADGIQSASWSGVAPGPGTAVCCAARIAGSRRAFAAMASSVDDRGRALGVVEGGLADRAQEEAGEAAASARAEDQQVGGLGTPYQGLRRGAGDQFGRPFHVGVVRRRAGNGLGDEQPCFLLDLLLVELQHR